MSTLYAFINQSQYDIWATQQSICEPSVERFLREVGTTRIKYSKEPLVVPFVPVKKGGCVRIIQLYPSMTKNNDIDNNVPQQPQKVEPNPTHQHSFFCRMKKFLKLKV